jgi:hypothetical protein
VIVKELVGRRQMPSGGRIYAGDSVRVAAPSNRGRVKGADLHILRPHHSRRRMSHLTVLGVIEVKSYPRSSARLLTQLSSHLAAARRGIDLAGAPYDSRRVDVAARPVRIAVVPAAWHLPRTFRFVQQDGQNVLRVDSRVPPCDSAVIKPMAHRTWHVTLRWSKEALAAAAYELTFWYMAKVGELVYAGGVPPEWASTMTPAEAGRNAAKMMLYYAILRAGTRAEAQRAIALYNAYGFGYALGTSFRNRRRSREMLWFEDLEEILAHGKTKHGCRLRAQARA